MTALPPPTLPTGLPIHRIELDGTRSVTVLVAFDAGARTERPPENGMAHFLEHLVFKGGEKFSTYRDVNETAERMGASLNAYTSHDLVAFHITARAEAAPQAIDLLTDFVGRPRIDAEELDRERGVVIPEIARAHDQPSVLAEQLIDEAAFGDHPLGRPVLGPEEHLRTFTREAIVAFRERRWAGGRAGAFIVGNPSAPAGDGTMHHPFPPLPSLPPPQPLDPAPPPAPRPPVAPPRPQPTRPRLRRGPPGARVREHERGGTACGIRVDRVRRGNRSGRGDRTPGRGHLRPGSRRRARYQRGARRCVRRAARRGGVRPNGVGSGG